MKMLDRTVLESLHAKKLILQNDGNDTMILVIAVIIKMILIITMNLLVIVLMMIVLVIILMIAMIVNVIKL